MNMRLFIISALLTCTFLSSCKKTAKDIIDCLAEDLYVTLHATPDGSNPKKIDFHVNYTGDHSVSSIEWIFGDGSTATVNGVSTSHTYGSAGSYTVKAKVKIINGSATCIPEPEKKITIN
ncbi:PKD domain-containing protein [Paraflavitalea sp. CAU 1676]|uniref:PKD domain-containing protein n=1 Tax=Paraflavitalea sp. CAU 1676 TaxID=3032598 RepID=UPI0023DAB3AA|nr:PKD domain-containing protein [Paraflavitalea sp. CAU 1676]MDF2190624.1 PKD domain-containing protein [Paraflavitalea sp. CAU 1676]